MYTRKLMDRYPTNKCISKDYNDIMRIYRRTLKNNETKFKDGILSQLANLKSNHSSKYWELFNKLKDLNSNDDTN